MAGSQEEPMNGRRAVRARPWLLVLGSGVTLWAVAGVAWAPASAPEVLFEPDYTILHVAPGGPLEAAGFLRGDSVVSVEGIPVSELGMYSRWPRSLARQPGESVTMVVERDGTRVSGEIVYRAPPPGGRRRLVGADLVGLAFVWLGVWSLFVAPSSFAIHLAGIGIVAGLCLPGPDLGSANGVRDDLQVATTVLWALLLCRFFLLFPRPKAWATRPGVPTAIVMPWVFLVVCLGLELAFHPRFYHTFTPLYGLLLGGYLLLALAALVHTVTETPWDELRASGMGSVLWGLGIGVGAVTAWIVTGVFAASSVPGASWLPLLLVAIPVGMARGVKKRVRQYAGDPVVDP